MKQPWPSQIRAMLRKEEDGMTAAELSQMLEAPKSAVYDALTRMPDAYVDRWTEPNKYQSTEQVWCVVVPPENCPRPDRRREPNGVEDRTY